MKVYVDQIMCTGTAVCESLSPIFYVPAGGLATVKLDGEPQAEGGAPEGVLVPEDQETLVRDAAAACPGSCIHIIED